MKPAPFEYHRPTTLDEALSILQDDEDGARVIAGGQSLGPMLNLRLTMPVQLIDISRLGELGAIEEAQNGVTVGASVRHVDFEDGRVPDVAAGLLQRTASEIAYRAVRNRGTVGGSVAHADPAADWPPVLMALGARAIARRRDGTRQILIRDLIVGNLTTSLEPAEVIEKIFIPRLPADASWGRSKITMMPGHFADSLAVVVRNGEAARATVVLSGRTLSPVVLARCARTVAAADGFFDTLAAELRGDVERDLKEAAEGPATSEDDIELHQASVIRAAREAWS